MCILCSTSRGWSHFVSFWGTGQGTMTTGSGPILCMSRSLICLADCLGMSSSLFIFNCGWSCSPGHCERKGNVAPCKHQPEPSRNNIESGLQEKVCDLSKQNRKHEAISSCSQEENPPAHSACLATQKPPCLFSVFVDPGPGKLGFRDWQLRQGLAAKWITVKTVGKSANPAVSQFPHVWNGGSHP